MGTLLSRCHEQRARAAKRSHILVRMTKVRHHTDFLLCFGKNSKEGNTRTESLFHVRDPSTCCPKLIVLNCRQRAMTIMRKSHWCSSRTWRKDLIMTMRVRALVTIKLTPTGTEGCGSQARKLHVHVNSLTRQYHTF